MSSFVVYLRIYCLERKIAGEIAWLIFFSILHWEPNIIDSNTARVFAVNYLRSRFRIQDRNFKEPSLQWCMDTMKQKMDSNLVAVTCNVLLLRQIDDKRLEAFTSQFKDKFPEVLEKRQLKFVLFHLLMDHIVRYTFSTDSLTAWSRKQARYSSFYMYFWYNPAEKLMNWGDILGPVFVSKMSKFKVIQVTKKIQGFPVFYGVGSILTQVMAEKRPCFTWGSGLIQKPTNVQLLAANETNSTRSNQIFFSVRGPESQMATLAVRGTFPKISKDPGLLVSQIFPQIQTQRKAVNICIIPHYVDKFVISSKLNTKKIQQAESYKIISISSKGNNFSKFAEEIPRQIINCQRVLSSSLHGLIASHAFGIRGAIFSISSKITGGNFKYRDYYESLGIYLHRDSLRHKISNLTHLGNMSYLSHLVDITPQPKFPISVKSIMHTYPYPLDKSMLHLL